MASYYYLDQFAVDIKTGLETIQVVSCGMLGWPFFREERLNIKSIDSTMLELGLKFPSDGFIQEFAYADQALEQQRQEENRQSRLKSLLATCFNSTNMVVSQGTLVDHSFPTIASDAVEATTSFRQNVTIRMAVKHPGCLPDWELFEKSETVALQTNFQAKPSTLTASIRQNFKAYQEWFLSRRFKAEDVLPFNDSAGKHEGFLRITAAGNTADIYEGELVLFDNDSPVSRGLTFYRRSASRIAGNLCTVNRAIFTLC